MKFINSFLRTFKNLDKQVLIPMEIVLKLSFILTLLSSYILVLNRASFLPYIFHIGIILFKSALSFMAASIGFAFAFNTIKEQIY